MRTCIGKFAHIKVRRVAPANYANCQIVNRFHSAASAVLTIGSILTIGTILAVGTVLAVSTRSAVFAICARSAVFAICARSAVRSIGSILAIGTRRTINTVLAVSTVHAILTIFTGGAILAIFAIKHHTNAVATTDNLYARTIQQRHRRARCGHAPLGNSIPQVIGALARGSLIQDPYHLAFISHSARRELRHIGNDIYSRLGYLRDVLRCTLLATSDEEKRSDNSRS